MFVRNVSRIVATKGDNYVVRFRWNPRYGKIIITMESINYRVQSSSNFLTDNRANISLMDSRCGRSKCAVYFTQEEQFNFLIKVVRISD